MEIDRDQSTVGDSGQSNDALFEVTFLYVESYVTEASTY